MLEPWSLQQSKWVKRLAALLYQGACLEKATCIRATSDLEKEGIRKAGYRNRIAVIPNGVELPSLPAETGVCDARTPRVALFLSRIHPKKGLLNLLRAWAVVQGAEARGRKSAVRGQGSEWGLRIVGPDECAYLAELKTEAERLGITETVQFRGRAYGAARTRCYLDADLFVLPSYSENFGLVIAEALACQVPVITTRATPWSELETARCGWWIETGVDPLVAALRDAFSRAPAELCQMGEAGRRLITTKYTWGPIGRNMLEVYEWAVSRGPKPGCVS